MLVHVVEFRGAEIGSPNQAADPGQSIGLSRAIRRREPFLPAPSESWV